MRPLSANPKRQSESATFHRRCFKQWGDKCWRCGRKAEEAAHIVGRAHLGKHRYACPEWNSRPLCRECHRAQTDNLWFWPAHVRREAVRELNKVLKIPLREPAA